MCGLCVGVRGGAWITSVPNTLQAVWKFLDKNAFPPSTTTDSGMISGTAAACRSRSSTESSRS